MKDYLVVANQTLSGEHLIDEIRRRLDEGPCRFHVVVPANVVSDRWTHDSQQAHDVAQQRHWDAIERFHELGAQADGRVGDERPMDAMLDALREWDCDEILLSTLPADMSRWLGMDRVWLA